MAETYELTVTYRFAAGGVTHAEHVAKDVLAQLTSEFSPWRVSTELRCVSDREDYPVWPRGSAGTILGSTPPNGA